MMEADEAPQKHVNVYITVDPTSLQKYRNSRRVELEYKQYLATPLGVLMISEFLFVLTLLFLAFGSGIYAFVVNSLNLLALIMLLVLSCCWLAEIWKTRITILLVLKIYIRGSMLVLHIVGFIFQLAYLRGRVQIVFIVVTMVYCCVLIVIITLLKEEYSRHATTRQTSGIAQKRKKSRPKRREYKKLGKSGPR